MAVKKNARRKALKATTPVMKAYVLIGLGDGDEQEVLRELLGEPEVAEAHILFGEWDLLAKLNIRTAEEAGTFVMDKVRRIPGVRLTSTLIVAK